MLYIVQAVPIPAELTAATIPACINASIGIPVIPEPAIAVIQLKAEGTAITIAGPAAIKKLFSFCSFMSGKSSISIVPVSKVCKFLGAR